ncbi:MAG: ribonuclease domain-containing protein [Clostridiales bacterium]|nr:ribonuclease domain-containing protein [Clostridiales bacterium]
MKKLLLRRGGALALSLLLLLSLLSGCAAPNDIAVTEVIGGMSGETAAATATPVSEESAEPSPEPSTEPTPALIDEDGWYDTPEDVAEYIHTYGRLPGNFITKSEAQELGWVSSEGNLWDVAYGMSIGGDRFGNREGLLPDAEGRRWYECDVNYSGGYRGGERIVFSSDGLVYYTADHYESFEQLY